MSSLPETLTEAHGGLGRWNELDAISTRPIQVGTPWAYEGPARRA